MSVPSGAPVAVLLVGARFDNVMAALELFHQAGITVDAISTLSRLRFSRRIRRFALARDSAAMLTLLRRALGDEYAVIVACDDDLLGAIKDSDWPDAERLRALPVIGLEHAGHLFSKIELSRRLEQGGVPTPAYRVAADAAALSASLSELGAPVLVKLDRSYGGFGTRIVASPADMEAVAAAPLPYPVLVQKCVGGGLASVEAFYRRGRLVFFACSDVTDTVGGPFGLSLSRCYRPSPSLPAPFRDELAALGVALGIDGFANISLIETGAGERFYFEADVRPNAWVAAGGRAGADPARRMREAFMGAAADSVPTSDTIAASVPDGRPVSLLTRAPLGDILLNRNRTWSTLPSGEGLGLVMLIVAGSIMRRVAAGWGAAVRRTMGPGAYHALQRTYLGTARTLSRLGHRL